MFEVSSNIQSPFQYGSWPNLFGVKHTSQRAMPLCTTSLALTIYVMYHVPFDRIIRSAFALSHFLLSLPPLRRVIILCAMASPRLRACAQHSDLLLQALARAGVESINDFGVLNFREAQEVLEGVDWHDFAHEFYPCWVAARKKIREPVEAASYRTTAPSESSLKSRPLALPPPPLLNSSKHRLVPSDSSPSQSRHP